MLRFALVVALGAAAHAETLELALLSDLHLDRYYGTPHAESVACSAADSPRLGQSGCDSPLALLRSAVNDVFARNGSGAGDGNGGARTGADAVLMAGDWLRHDMAAAVPDFAAAANLTYHDVAALWADTSVATRGGGAATALGNNDFVPDYVFDYSAAAPPALLTKETEALTGIQMLPPTGSDAATTFSRYGYALLEVPTGTASRGRHGGAAVGATVSVVVLNTLLWSMDLLPRHAAAGAVPADPGHQLAFVDSALRNLSAAGRHAYVVGHIPPVLNLFEVARDPRFDIAADPDGHYWNDAYTRAYAATLRRFPGVVAAQFFGHTHRSSFVADQDAALGGVPLFVLGAVSPVYGNRPTHLRATVDATSLAILDMRPRYLAQPGDPDYPNASTADPAVAAGGPVWVDGPTFRAEFAVPPLVPVSSTAALAATGAQMLTDDAAYSAWLRRYSGGIVNGPCPDTGGNATYCRLLASCYSVYGNRSAIAQCVASAHGTPVAAPTPSPGPATPPTPPPTGPATPVPDGASSPAASSRSRRAAPIVACVVISVAFVGGIVAVGVWRCRRPRETNYLSVDETGVARAREEGPVAATVAAVMRSASANSGGGGSPRRAGDAPGDETALTSHTQSIRASGEVES